MTETNTTNFIDEFEITVKDLRPYDFERYLCDLIMKEYFQSKQYHWQTTLVTNFHDVKQCYNADKCCSEANAIDKHKLMHVV